MIFRYAQNSGELSFLHVNCATFRMSLYADDAVIFINPTLQDLNLTKQLLHLFSEVTGMITNLEKIEILRNQVDR
jgi:hypothetical protein